MDGLEQRKEEMRDMRRVHWLTDFFDDVHYALRSLRRTPLRNSLRSRPARMPAHCTWSHSGSQVPCRMHSAKSQLFSAFW